MRAGNAFHRIKFYAKSSTRDIYGASVDSWPVVTISTRGEVRWSGGNRMLSNEEKFYSRNMELTVRYQNTITETMKVQIDGTATAYMITYIEVLGRNEALRITIEKQADNYFTLIPSITTDSTIITTDTTLITADRT